MRAAKPFLIVARNVDVQDLYVLHMRSQRVSVLGVNTCDEAISVCRQAPCAAVLFDIEHRHDWDSLALFRKELAHDVPIVVLSGWISGEGTYRTLARTLGCAGFIAKPASPVLVGHALERAAHGSPWDEYVNRPA